MVPQDSCTAAPSLTPPLLSRHNRRLMQMHGMTWTWRRGLAEPHVGASVGPALAPRAPAAPGRRSGVFPFPAIRHAADPATPIRRSDVEPHLQVRPSRDEFDALATHGPWFPSGRSCSPTSRRPSGLFPALAGDGPGRSSGVRRALGALGKVLVRGRRSRRRPWSWTATASGSGPVRDAPRVALRGDAGAARRCTALARSLAGPRLADLPPLIGGPDGYLALRGRRASSTDIRRPSPATRRARRSGSCVIDRAVVFDHWRQRLILVAHVPAGGYDGRVAALHELAARSRPPRLPALAPPVPPPVASVRGDAEHAPTRATAGSCRPSRSTSWPGTSSRACCRGGSRSGAGRRPPGLPAAPRHEPRAVHVLPADARAWSSPARRPSRWSGSRAGASRPGPIAGTRPRGADRGRATALLEHELLADPKEQAEHAMLVDLARNDLGRVCVAGSVRPTELMEVERFTKVMHIVSTVEGELREELHPLDALAVDVPGRNRDRRAEAASDGADRGARAHGARPVRRRGRLPHVRRGPRLLHHDPDGGHRRRTACQSRRAPASSPTPTPRRELRETKAKAAALLPAVAPGDGTLGGVPTDAEGPA